VRMDVELHAVDVADVQPKALNTPDGNSFNN
jgi:hypothetical protein